jgi:hypothetical protein
MRPAAACIASGESIARTACTATRASRTIVLISARANMTPKSDGLTGAASIRTTTSGPGAGRAASTKARVTVLSACTVERSCQVWVGGIAIHPCRDGSELAHVHSVSVKRHGLLLAHAREAQPWHRVVALRRVWVALYGAVMQGAQLSYAPAQRAPSDRPAAIQASIGVCLSDRVALWDGHLREVSTSWLCWEAVIPSFGGMERDQEVRWHVRAGAGSLIHSGETATRALGWRVRKGVSHLEGDELWRRRRRYSSVSIRGRP